MYTYVHTFTLFCNVNSDSLNSSTVTPIRADVDGNITKLSNKFKSNPSSLVTLQAMVKFELDTNTHQESESATTALLWLRRCVALVLSALYGYKTVCICVLCVL